MPEARERKVLVKAFQVRATTVWLFVFSIVQGLPILYFFVLQNLVAGTDIYSAHFADLVLQVPLMTMSLTGLLFSIRSESGLQTAFSKVLVCTLIASTVILFEGHGIHFAANSLAAQMDHSKVGKKLAALNYFYDEQLGHWLTFIGLSGVLLSAFALECKAPNIRKCNAADSMLILCSGMFSGVVSTIVALEAQSAWLMMLMFAAIALGSYKFHRGKKSIGTYPLGIYLMVLLATAICVLVFWLLRFHSLMEPLKGGLFHVTH